MSGATLEERLRQAIQDTCDDRNYLLAQVLEDAMTEIQRLREPCDDCPIPRCDCGEGFTIYETKVDNTPALYTECPACGARGKVGYKAND